jgi:hypothetical protein
VPYELNARRCQAEIATGNAEDGFPAGEITKTTVSVASIKRPNPASNPRRRRVSRLDLILLEELTAPPVVGFVTQIGVNTRRTSANWISPTGILPIIGNA